MRRPIRTVLSVGTAVAVIGLAFARHEVTKDPIETIAPLQPAVDIAFFNDNKPPQSIKHFGLQPDRGLPLSVVAGGEGDTIVVGAPPKAWRFVYTLPMGLAYSNAFPSWLPTALYGTDWYFTEDWRGKMWTSSGDSAGPRLELSNGVEFIECSMAGASAINESMTFSCPEDPELKVTTSTKIGGRIPLNVDSPDGTRRVFLQDFANQDKFSQTAVQKLATGGAYVDLVKYVRDIVDPSGTYTLKPDPERKIHKIVRFGPTQATTASQYVLGVTTLIWKDTNAETRDCQMDQSTDPQCSSGDHCYDRRCTGLRSGDTASGCYSMLCGDWADDNFLASLFVSSCRNLLCGTSSNPAACWAQKQPCDNDPPDLSGGDWKLARIITPSQASLHEEAHAQTSYTLLYNGNTEKFSKYLRAIEDNRGPGFGFDNYVPVPQQVRPATGNTVQFGYDLLLDGRRGLKAVSFERGYDRSVRRFDFTKENLISKFWTDRRDPYTFEYAQPSSNARTHTLTMRDPTSLVRKVVFDAIGARLPTPGSPCSEVDGCNIQLGLGRDEPATGGAVVMTYAPAGRGASTGRLETKTDADGRVTTYGLDDANYGRVKSELNDSSYRAFQYLDTSFVQTPTKIEDYVLAADCADPEQRTKVRTIQNTLCSATSGGCTENDYGKTTASTTKFENAPAGSEVVTNVSYTGSEKTVTVSDNAATAVVAKVMERDSVGGVPREVHVPGQDRTPRVDTTQTGMPSVDTLPPCNPRNEDCSGTATATESVKVAADVEWPFATLPKELEDLKITGKGTTTAAGESDEVAKQMGSSKSSTSSSPSGTAESSVQYDKSTGVPIRRTTTENGVAVREDYEWARAVHATVTPGATRTKMNSAGMTATKRYVNDVFVGGEFMRYQSDSQMNPTDTWRGPMARGHYKADGTEAPTDYAVTTDPRDQHDFVVGCGAQGTGGGVTGTCYSDFDCPCGRCTADPDDGRQGVCLSTGTGTTTFVCKRKFLGDPMTTQEINLLSYQRVHTSEWFRQQCTAPRCAADTRLCDNDPQ